MPDNRFDHILQYQGRSALRSDSRIRRKAILEAALRVIERDGVRGVKHRAVASEADVPLAATTYYFDDIQSLLHDAFVHYVETRLSSDSARLQEQAGQLLSQLQSAEDDSSTQSVEVANRGAHVRQLLSNGIADILFSHIQAQVARDHERRVEAAFRHEALRNEGLAKLVAIPHRLQLEAIEDFFAALGSGNSRADAQVTMGTLLYLEYNLVLDASEANWVLAETTLKRMMDGLLGVTAW